MIEMEQVKIGLQCIIDGTVWCESCGYSIDKHGHYSCQQECAKDAIALLKDQDWISVKDRLPNCNGCYLVWRPHFYTDKGMPSICYFDGQNTWHDSYGVDFTRTLASEDVSHWKPLPEQPCKAVK